jgi:hypothetical protein
MTQTTELTESRQIHLDEYEADLMSGAVFARHAFSARSHLGYEPPMTSRDWAHVIVTLGQMAGSGDALARLTRSILANGTPNLYGTRSQAMARVKSAAAAALREGFDDVIGRTGPEPKRYSEAQSDYSLRTRLELLCWLTVACAPLGYSVPGIGWCAQLLCEREGVNSGRILAAIKS